MPDREPTREEQEEARVDEYAELVKRAMTGACPHGQKKLGPCRNCLAYRIARALAARRGDDVPSTRTDKPRSRNAQDARDTISPASPASSAAPVGTRLAGAPPCGKIAARADQVVRLRELLRRRHAFPAFPTPGEGLVSEPHDWEQQNQWRRAWHLLNAEIGAALRDAEETG